MTKDETAGRDRASIPDRPDPERTVTIPPKKKTLKLTDFSSCAG